MPKKEEKISQAPVILAFRLAFLALITNAVLLILIIVASFFIAGGTDISTAITREIILFILILIIEMSAATYIFLSWKNFYYVINSDSIKVHFGVISQNGEDNIMSEGLDNITYRQSFFGRLLNYGDIIIAEPRSETKTLLAGIPDPQEMVSMIEKKFKIPEKPE